MTTTKTTTRDDLLARLGRADRKLEEDAAERAGIRAELEAMDAEAVRQANEPRLERVREAPTVECFVATQKPHGGFDAGQLVPSDVMNLAILARGGWLEVFLGGGLARPRAPLAIVAQGRRCLGAPGHACGLVFADEPRAAEHWRRRHRPDVVRALEAEAAKEQREEREREAYRAETRAREARLEGWRHEIVDGQRPKELHPGYPIPRPDTDGGPEAA